MLHPNEANYIPLNAGLGLQSWCFPTVTIMTTTVTIYFIHPVVRFYRERLSQLCRHKGDRGKERLKVGVVVVVFCPSGKNGTERMFFCRKLLSKIAITIAAYFIRPSGK